MIDQLEHHFILFSLIFFFIGFILAKQLDNSSRPIREKDNVEESFVKKHTKAKKKLDTDTEMDTISIDTSTHVVKIKTDGLQKQYEEIAQQSSTNEDINSSVNKLKSLKK